MAEPPIDFSKTQRIVLLIDLNPLFQNPNHHQPYIAAVLAASKTLLSFPPLSSSLFSFRLFFSSLSPVLSSSALHRLFDKPPTSRSFNNPSQTLSSLSSFLTSISISSQLTISGGSVASNTAGSLLQLVHDYNWDSQIVKNHLLTGMKDDSSVVVRSNLVVLFSPVCRSMKCLAEFMCIDVSDECLSCFDKFNVKFRDVFGIINDAFVGKDIHFSWIDVNYEIESIEGNDEVNRPVQQLGYFEKGVRCFDWGFCSTDSIVLGSALVSFGLIYPNVGVSLKFMNYHRSCKRIKGQLKLEILDVSGKPLECKGCDVDLMHMNIMPKFQSDGILKGLDISNSESEGFNPSQAFWTNFSDGQMNLHVKAVQRYTKGEKFEECSSNIFLVRELTTKSSGKKCSDNSIVDRVLKLLSNETSRFIQENSLPIWQIFLDFLHREGYWALLSISNSGGNSCMGILKPFTVHSGFLYVIDAGHRLVDNIDGSNLSKMGNVISKCSVEMKNSKKIEDVISKGNVNMNNSKGFSDLQFGTSSSKNCTKLGDGKRRKNKKIPFKDLTWNSFFKAAFECSEFELAEYYFATDANKSKKLKFLICWMKQMKNSTNYILSAPSGSKSHHHAEKELDERLTGSYQESREPLSDPLPCYQESGEPLSEQMPSDQSSQQEDNTPASCSETSESFFHNLPKKIQHGIESEGVDLQILAERLVSSSIHYFHQKQESGNTIKSQTPIIEPEEPPGTTVAELIQCLLQEPKNLKEKHKDKYSSLQATDSSSTVGDVVRDYELQILLRMEILRSEIAGSMKELMKQKLVKQICSLLEIIQYLVEGGLHGNVSLCDYVERTIKTRYSHDLEDVVDKIYDKMDLLPFGDEVETQVLLFNSEDSNHSWRDMQERHEIAETRKTYESFSAEDDSSQQPLENADEIPQETRKEDHFRKLNEARERRETAKRFGSFTRWIPLQRLWAPPKQTKVAKLQAESGSKRKRTSKSSYSVVVCETPMTGNVLERGERDDDGHENNSSSKSVSKALFQDDR